MSYTLQQAYDDLGGIAHGRSIAKITNPIGAATRAGASVLAIIDPAETRRFAQIKLFDGVIDYNLPMTDLKENGIFDIRPQVNRHMRDNLGSRMSKDFDMKQGQNDWGDWGSWFSIEDDTGTKYIRVLKKFNPGAAALDPLDDDTNWIGSGGATNVEEDTVYAVDESGTSLSLDLIAASSPGYLTNTKIVSTDLSDFSKAGSFFLWVYFPNTATDITTMKLRWGSSAAAYWEQTGVIHRGSAVVGWNLFRFDWPTAIQTGTVDATKITYARVEFDYPAAGVVGVRVDKLFVSLPRVWNIGYYSNALFNNSGTWGETPTDTSATINLARTNYNLFLYEFALAGLQQIQGKDAIADRTYFENRLGDPVVPGKSGLYEQYKKNNPSQREKVTQTWYGGVGRIAFKRK